MRTLMILLIGLCSITSARTLPVDAFVLRGQTETERKAHYGRNNEIVRNTTRPDIPMTVYDGETVGGFPVMAGIDNYYFVKRGVDAETSGDNLLVAFEYSNSRDDDNVFIIFAPPGEYDFGDSTITNRKSHVKLSGISFVTSYYDWFSYVGHSTTYATLITTAPYVFVDINPYAYTHTQFIYTDSSVKFGSGSAHINCSYIGGVQILGSPSRALFNNCDVIDGLTTPIYSGSSYNTAFIRVSLPPIAGTVEYFNAYVIMCPEFFSAPVGEGYDLKILNSTIGAEKMFWQGDAASCNVVARGCVFQGYSNTWITSPDSEFWNCNGVDPNIVNTAKIVVGCIDKNGNRVPDVP